MFIIFSWFFCQKLTKYFYFRYGTEPEREKARLLRHAARTITRKVWSKEKDDIEKGEYGSVKWTAKEMKQVKSSGSVDNWEVVYRNNPQEFPELANDLDNVVLIKAGKKHGHHWWMINNTRSDTAN